MPDRIRFEPVKVAMKGQSEARLVFVDEKLAAVIAKLDDSQAEFKGLWYAEAAFNGLEAMRDETFPTLDAAADWIRKRV